MMKVEPTGFRNSVNIRWRNDIENIQGGLRKRGGLVTWMLVPIIELLIVWLNLASNESIMGDGVTDKHLRQNRTVLPSTTSLAKLHKRPCGRNVA